MNILVLNASPKGINSTTVHTALYLQALHPEHDFTVLHVGKRIKSYEQDFSPVRKELEKRTLFYFATRFIPSLPPISSTVSSN